MLAVTVLEDTLEKMVVWLETESIDAVMYLQELEMVCMMAKERKDGAYRYRRGLDIEPVQIVVIFYRSSAALKL